MTEQAMTRLKPGKILDTLGAMKNSLTRVSQRIADYILFHPTEVTQLSIAQLSQATKAGEATVVRFCRTLGYKGFQDFKMDLAIEMATSDSEESPILDAEVSHEDDIHTIGLKLQATINNVLSETLNLLDMKQVQGAVNALLPANYIFICGVGSSGITAEDLKNKLMRIGHRVDAVTNNHFMYMQASLLKPGDVAIGISHSGNSPETVHALKVAKEAGAITIALTHNLGSQIMEYADYHLINGNRQGKLQGDSIGTKTAQLFVLDLLYTLLVQAQPEMVKEQKLRTLNALKHTHCV
ncbi:RpiR family transcriptional regulator [Proteus hauseri ATCC 700826]|uniref:RpiR family transcriptional regulator n=1 Tax=Proteus hauseri ATCC 700826 TaxID=1354271 RepID=A0AAJ3LVC8_PROHU|nr:MurR/RpiR family transcriptional regulator [Proteus hauseri]OAT51141.1 RpiR family transcriptional regulator [Proteus hauseri ATCC 700826]